jgi:hypothetical protein
MATSNPAAAVPVATLLSSHPHRHRSILRCFFFIASRSLRHGRHLVTVAIVAVVVIVVSLRSHRLHSQPSPSHGARGGVTSSWPRLPPHRRIVIVFSCRSHAGLQAVAESPIVAPEVVVVVCDIHDSGLRECTDLREHFELAVKHAAAHTHLSGV